MYTKIKNKAFNILRRYINNNSKNFLINNKELWETLCDYLKNTESSGCSYIDYAKLYKYVYNNKPKEILECGTGVSTIIIAQALKDSGGEGRITSMESEEKYFNLASRLLPGSLSDYVDLVCSPVIEDHYSLFRGCRYQDIPIDRPYEFIYVDGPSYIAPSDKTITFDFDYIYIVMQSSHPVYAIIDKRVSTCYVLQKVFGTNKVKYDAIRHLGYAGPCTKYDLKHFSNLEPSKAFEDSFRLLKDTELKLIFNEYSKNNL